MRLRERQLGEEHVVDVAVVVLTCVHEALLDGATPFELGVDRSDLHVVRPCADHVNDEFPLHPLSLGPFWSVLPPSIVQF